MAEYLKRDDVLTNSEILTVDTRDYGRIDVVPVEYLADIPSADVQPVKHGQWVHDGSGSDGRDNWYHCSECNRVLNIICGKKLEDYPYCHCGARMDLKDGDAE